jgi:RNA polymerase sigma factor (sigma-70 family)
VRDHLARAIAQVGRQIDAEAADGDLLRRFIDSRDEAAFAQIVRRYGPMVYGVCRRVIGHQQDSEDAFQATFIVLARKAEKVRPGELSRWLYGVALRVATTQRNRAKKHRSLVDFEPEAKASVASDNDWLPLLDQALTRLPERYRLPIFLCDLQGKSRTEAANELGIAEGTLSSRLARGRENLRRKLSGLGFALTLPALVQSLQDQASALSPNLTFQIGPASTKLAEGVMYHMAMIKLAKWSVLGICLAGATTMGVVSLPGVLAEPQAVVQQFPKEKPKEASGEAPKAGEAKVSRLQQLREERVKALQAQLKIVEERVKAGTDQPVSLGLLYTELRDARVAVAMGSNDWNAKERYMKELVDSLTTIEKQMVIMHEQGLRTNADLMQTRAARLKAEIEYEEFKEDLKRPRS